MIWNLNFECSRDELLYPGLKFPWPSRKNLSRRNKSRQRLKRHNWMVVNQWSKFWSSLKRHLFLVSAQTYLNDFIASCVILPTLAFIQMSVVPSSVSVGLINHFPDVVVARMSPFLSVSFTGLKRNCLTILISEDCTRRGRTSRFKNLATQTGQMTLNNWGIKGCTWLIGWDAQGVKEAKAGRLESRVEEVDGQRLERVVRWWTH